MKSKYIICVDDEAIILYALKLELMNYFGGDFSYETAVNGIEALEIIDEIYEEGGSVFLIISDWVMPGMSGDEFLLKTDEKHPETHKMIITGQRDDGAISALREKLRLESVITKPWDFSQIAEKIEELTG